MHRRYLGRPQEPRPLYPRLNRFPECNEAGCLLSRKRTQSASTRGYRARPAVPCGATCTKSIADRQRQAKAGHLAGGKCLPSCQQPCKFGQPFLAGHIDITRLRLHIRRRDRGETLEFDKKRLPPPLFATIPQSASALTNG